MTGKRKIVKKTPAGHQGNHNVVGRRRKAALQYIKEMPLDVLFEFCSTAIVQAVIWEAMCRCCNKCIESAFMSGWDADEELYQRDLRIPNKMWRLFPRFIPRTVENQKDFRTYCIYTWKNDERCLHGSLPDRDGDGSYLRTETRRIIRSFEQVPKEQRQQWLQGEVEVAEARHIRECRKWQSEDFKRQGLVRDRVKNERYQAILQRLEEPGWKEDLSLPSVRDKFRKHKLVNQSRPLTDRIWRNIGPPLADFLRTEIRGLAESERYHIRRNRAMTLIDLLSERRRHLPRNHVMPALLDVVLWQPVWTIIGTRPYFESTPRSVFDGVTSQLSSFVQEWNDSRIRIILESLRRHRSGSTEADLLLSTSLFRCTNLGCRGSQSVYPYPAVLYHACGETRSGSSSEERTWISEVASFGARDRGLAPYSSSLRVEVHPTAALVSEAICHLSQLDPTTTTLDTMFKLNPVVECGACMKKGGRRRFMRWTAAVNHLHHHDFRAVSATERLDVEGRERGSRRDVCDLDPDFRCKRCTFRETSVEDIKAHLSLMHGISPARDEDWEFWPLFGPILVEMGPTSVWVPSLVPSEYIHSDTQIQPKSSLFCSLALRDYLQRR
ncbi:hypothetical protein PM082_018026 [Marasmius tenuissimus]|nr:hypothetical protein PM082_018026 [Marasmius tenuissimus]